MKEILFDKEGRIRLLEGANKACSVVAATLGAKGRNVIIFEKKGVYPYVTKDGINTISRIILDDPVENMGAQLIRQASQKTAEETGDGTTATAIISYYLMDRGMALIDKDYSQLYILKSLEHHINNVIEEVKKASIEPSEEDIKNIAIISSNNDQSIGTMIGDLMNSLGKNGKVVVQDSINGKTYYEESPGMKIDSGWISPYQVNVHHKGTMEYDKPLIMVTEEEIFRVKQVETFVGICLKAQRPGVIVCTNCGGEALGTINHNIVNKGLKFGVITAPDHGGLSRDILSDIATYCGAVLVTEKTGKATEKVTFEMLGECDKWVSDSNETTVIKGKGSINIRIKELENYIANGKDEKKVKDSQERLSNLTGKTAVFYVYADTPSELVEKKDRIDDALHATKAAMKEGIVPGGGLTLWNIAMNYSHQPINDIDKEVALMVLKAIKQPMLQILRNAGLNISNYSSDLTDTNGVNVVTEQIENLVENGIVDPTMSIRVSLKNALSVAKTILSTDVVLT